MAKKKKKKLNVQAKTFNLEEVAEPHFPPIRLIKSQTENIAYKFRSSELIDLITNDSKQLGVQFEFKVFNDASQELNSINLSRLYYNRDGEGKFKREPVSDELLNRFSQGNQIFDIEVFEEERLFSQRVFSHHDLATTPSRRNPIKVYKNLDFFDNQINFVFFTVDQLKFLFDNYQSLFISGYPLSFGKKLNHDRRRAGDDYGIYNDPYFSLKIEGLRYIGNNAQFREKSSNGEVVAEILNFALGHPCPPAWYPLTLISEGARRINPNVSSMNLRAAWINHVQNMTLPISSVPNNNTNGGGASS